MKEVRVRSERVGRVQGGRAGLEAYLLVALVEVVEPNRVEGTPQGLHRVHLELELRQVLRHRSPLALPLEVLRDLLQKLGDGLHRDFLPRRLDRRLANDPEAPGPNHFAHVVLLVHLLVTRVAVDSLALLGHDELGRRYVQELLVDGDRGRELLLGPRLRGPEEPAGGEVLLLVAVSGRDSRARRPRPRAGGGRKLRRPPPPPLRRDVGRGAGGRRYPPHHHVRFLVQARFFAFG